MDGKGQRRLLRGVFLVVVYLFSVRFQALVPRPAKKCHHAQMMSRNSSIHSFFMYITFFTLASVGRQRASISSCCQRSNAWCFHFDGFSVLASIACRV